MLTPVSLAHRLRSPSLVRGDCSRRDSATSLCPRVCVCVCVSGPFHKCTIWGTIQCTGWTSCPMASALVRITNHQHRLLLLVTALFLPMLCFHTLANFVCVPSPCLCGCTSISNWPRLAQPCPPSWSSPHLPAPLYIIFHQFCPFDYF